MTTKPTIVSAGYMPLDLIHTTVGTVDRQAGGTAANVAAILAFLGWDAVLAGQGGDDLAGEELVADLRRAGVDTGQVRRTAGTLTPRVVHGVRPDGHFFSYRCPDCESRFPRSRQLTLEAAAACAQAHPSPTVFFFDRANPGTLWLAEEYARREAIIVFEPSVPANAELLARAATVAHVIKHSDDRSVGGLDDLQIKPRPGQLRIVTHGAEGLELRIGARRGRRFPALATLAIDTGGAGDWTTAGLLARAVRRERLDPDKLDSALRFGQALAAVSCTAVGARGLMRLTRGSVLRRVRSVLAEGGLTSEPRLPDVREVLRPTDGCPSCLMPFRSSGITERPTHGLVDGML
ncbi:MAG: PfkB family carbohydrate kinase [Solirubrobacteraceae bacterium MAG38_C4-C5]|nr:PfkB family carbohydrate kinase [Candidatus Siliceabacter maunaloa]